MISVVFLGYLFQRLREDRLYARHGIEADAWYSDLDEQNPILHYAYRVGTIIYSGEQSWNDMHSGIYYHHNGYPVRITYLSNEPWVSRPEVRPIDRWHSTLKVALCLFTLLVGSLVLVFVPRSRRPQSNFEMSYGDKTGSLETRPL